MMTEDHVLHFWRYFYYLCHLPVPVIGTGLLASLAKHSFICSDKELL